MRSKKPKCVCDEKKITDNCTSSEGCNKQLPVITYISKGTVRNSGIFDNLVTHCSSECQIKETTLQFSVLCAHTFCTSAHEFRGTSALTTTHTLIAS